MGLLAGSGMINGYADCEAPHIIKGYMEPQETITINSESQSNQHAPKIMYQHNKKSHRLKINILTPHGLKSLS